MKAAALGDKNRCIIGLVLTDTKPNAVPHFIEGKCPESSPVANHAVPNRF